MRTRIPQIILSVLLSGALFFSASGSCSSDLFMVETKVQNDLEQSLSHVISRDQFIVHVSADIQTKSERKVAEMETFRNGVEELEQEEDEKPPVMMPGFTLEKTETLKDPSKQGKQDRQIYRLFETPYLAQVRVHVGLDKELPADTVTTCKNLVQSYLGNAHPNRAVVVFTQIPMLKTTPEVLAHPGIPNRRVSSKEPELTEDEDADKSPSKNNLKDPNKELTPEEWIKANALLVLLGVLSLMILILALNRNHSVTTTVKRSGWPKTKKQADEEPRHSPSPAFIGAPPMPMPNFSRGLERSENELYSQLGENRDEFSSTSEEKDAAASLEFHRKRFLRTIIDRSEAFKLYHDSLAKEAQMELLAALQGPAYESFLVGLGVKVSKLEESDIPSDLNERLIFHEKSFAEFVQAKEWQDKQFFGFLHRLSNEQVMTLVNHEDPFTVAVMLRFLKPQQSAYCLDQLSAKKRRDVLGQIGSITSVPFSELAQIEKAVRQTVQRFPKHFFGAPREDVEYWGRVLAESQEQDRILEDIEKTNPEIFPALSKFKFKLEDAKNLPTKLLRQILADSDNEELGMALSTCPQALTEFFLGAVSPQRREFLEDQLSTKRNADKKLATEARLALTRRFREAIA